MILVHSICLVIVFLIVRLGSLNVPVVFLDLYYLLSLPLSEKGPFCVVCALLSVFSLFPRSQCSFAKLLEGSING